MCYAVAPYSDDSLYIESRLIAIPYKDVQEDHQKAEKALAKMNVDYKALEKQKSELMKYQKVILFMMELNT